MTAPADDVGSSQALIASLRAERDAALAVQAALAEVIEAINRDPSKALDTILTAVLRLSGSAFGGIATYDGETLHMEIMHGAEATVSKVKPEPGTMAHRVLIGGEDIAWLPDIRDDEAYRAGVPARVRAADVLGARTQLMAALRREGKPIGVINIFRREVKPFTDAQIALVKAFAGQAVIAMENARLITETREALERQTATSEVLGVINSSPGALAPVFDAMLEKAMQLCASDFGFMNSYDGSRFKPVAQRGVPSALQAYFAAGPDLPGPGEAHTRVLAGEDLIHSLDYKDEDAYQLGNPLRRAVVDLGGARTALVVALRREGLLLGTMTIYRREVRPFTDKQIGLLQNFAAQAVIAMENARLLGETREALERQTATAEVLAVISASPGNLAPVFDVMLDRAVRLCEAAYGMLYSYEDGAYRTLAVHNLPPAYERSLQGVLVPLKGNVLGRLASGERLVHIPDLRADEAYRTRDPIRVASVELGGARTYVAVPLLKDDVMVGAIAAYRQDVRPFTEKQIALLENFAAQAVIAMENARLITEQREALERQTAMAGVLHVINTSQGNRQPVFEAILDKTMDLCGAAFAEFYTFSNGIFQQEAYRGLTQETARARRQPTTIEPGTMAWRLREGADVLHIADLREEPAYRESDRQRMALLNLGRARTVLNVALRQDGALRGCILLFRTEVRPFNDQQVELVQTFASQAVIAMENARLLDELRQRQEELRVTFENMGDGVAMFDETQHLVAWNRKFQGILDLPDGVLAERLTFAEYIRYLAERGEYGAGADPEDQIRRLTENIDRYRSLERVRPDGRVIEVRHNPVPAGGFVLIYADITDRKRNEAEIRAARDAAEEASRTIEAAYRDLKAAQANLIQAEKMASLGQLTAGIAHEIKNPLNFINNFSDLSVDLLEELKEIAAPAFATLDVDRRADIDNLATTLTGNLAKIAEHGRRADGIVRSMLEHSRGTSGERRPADLNALVEEALNLAYHGARAQDQSFNITLERDLSPGIAPIELNPQDITRVLLNLCSNGFYAAHKRQNAVGAPYEPCLRLTTRDLRDAVEIRVRDNGTGIPIEIRDKLFQPFFTTKPTGEGTGLGLSLSYDIVVKQHGGRLSVDSAINEFTEFVVTLPRTMAANHGDPP